MICIYLKAPNDVNGNPRRLYVLVDNERALVVVDEGYSGWSQFEFDEEASKAARNPHSSSRSHRPSTSISSRPSSHSGKIGELIMPTNDVPADITSIFDTLFEAADEGIRNCESDAHEGVPEADKTYFRYREAIKRATEIKLVYPRVVAALTWILDYIDEHPEWDFDYFREGGECHAESYWYDEACSALGRTPVPPPSN